MINFDTDKIILVCFSRWAGGKFLINSLGLSDNAVLQNRILADRQLKQGMDGLEKLQYMRPRIVEMKYWDDMGLGCFELFGLMTNDPKYKNCPDKHKLHFSNVIHTLSNSDYKFFLAAHRLIDANEYLELWPNCKIIVFTDSKPFLNWRSQNRYSNTDQYNVDWEHEYKNLISDNVIHFFDNNVYFDEDKTCKEVETLYTKLELGSYNDQLIRNYYRLWKSKLQETFFVGKPE